MRLLCLLLGIYLIDTGLSQRVTQLFHRTFSHGCTEKGINTEYDCPNKTGISQWSAPKTTAESSVKFKTIIVGSKKCYYKQTVEEQKCNSVPTCGMTLYKYNLPRPPKNIGTIQCTNESSLETACKANGPGGKNTKAVYSECFTKKGRSYCSIRFERCTPQQCFEWTNFKRQCYVPCSNPSYSGIAIKSVRRCRECNGNFVDEENCKGGKDGSFTIRKCQRTALRKPGFPDCLLDTTQATSTSTSTASESTTKGSVEVTSSYATRTKTVTKTTKMQHTATKTPDATDQSIQTEATTYSKKSSTGSKRTISASSTTVIVIPGDTKHSNVDSTLSPVIEKKITSFSTPLAKDDITTSTQVNLRALLPALNFSTAPPKGNSSGFLGEYGEETKTSKLDVVTIAGGAGAGLFLLLFIVIAMVLLARRRDTKSASISNVSSTSSYRNRSSRNPVVDSSSFRIATWIRERPSLPNGGSRSPTESVVSDAEYWKIGESAEELTARYVSSGAQSESSDGKVPDLVRVRHSRYGDEHIYDELSFEELEEVQGAAPNHAPNKRRHTSVISSQSEPGIPSASGPIDKNAVYAVVQKAKNREKKNARKRSSTSSTSDVRKRIASNRSVTHLNGRHLREGVLQIEFDEEEGIKCKLSESDVYINLEEDDDEIPTAV